MKYLLVAHPEKDGAVDIPSDWTGSTVDHATHTGCCETTRKTCDALLQGASVTPTLLEIHLRLATPCVGHTASLHGVNALSHTRAVREWLARNNPQQGLIVGGAYFVKAVLVGICDELENYAIVPGDVVLIQAEKTRRAITFYKPRH